MPGKKPQPCQTSKGEVNMPEMILRGSFSFRSNKRLLYYRGGHRQNNLLNKI
jgi:hypothetical protein